MPSSSAPLTSPSASPRDAPSIALPITAPGPAAIVGIRLSGPRVAAFLDAHIRVRAKAGAAQAPFRRAQLIDPAGEQLDDILLYHEAPETDEAVAQPAAAVRVFLHGGPYLSRTVLDWAEQLGFRIVTTPTVTDCLGRELLSIEPSAASGAAFTPIADLWTAPSLIHREAYALLPLMPTLRGVTWLLEGARELVRLAESLLNTKLPLSPAQQDDLANHRTSLATLEALCRPLRIGLRGRPNVGKSTLINALAGRGVSLVSPIPGTTRDWVEAPDEIDGLPVVWIDTAGLRDTDDPLERAGISQAAAVADRLDIRVLVLDATDPGEFPGLMSVWPGPPPDVVVLNKCDLAPPTAGAASVHASHSPMVRLSALQATGLEALRSAILTVAEQRRGTLRPPGGAFTARQVLRLGAALDAAEQNKSNLFTENILALLGRADGRV